MAETIPLSVPDDLLEEVRKTAKQTNLSMQDVFRQSTRLGMPKLIEQLSGRLSLAPLSDNELAASFAKMSAEEIEEDAQLGRASLKAQKAGKAGK